MASQITMFDEPAAGEYEIPDGAKPERCRSCGAAIVWGQTRTGAAIPINVNQQRIIGGKAYGKTHFATCPHGREWRRH
jgi:hypothetical protein